MGARSDHLKGDELLVDSKMMVSDNASCENLASTSGKSLRLAGYVTDGKVSTAKAAPKLHSFATSGTARARRLPQQGDTLPGSVCLYTFALPCASI